MQIHINKDGQQLGPYTLDQVNEYLAQGSLQATDPAWHDGLADWCPLNQIAGVVDASSPAPPAFDSATFNPNAAAPPTVAQSNVPSPTPNVSPVMARAVTCPGCQAPVQPEMLFCGACGQDLQGDWQEKSVPHSGSPAEDDPLKQNFPKKKVLLACGGALSLICITALLYWIFGGGINPVGTYEGMSAADPGDTPELYIYTLYDNGTAEHWVDGETIEGKWELQGEEVHFTAVYDGDEIIWIFQLYEDRLEMFAAQFGGVRRNLPDESEGSLRGRVFVKTERNKPPASIASKPDDEGEDEGEDDGEPNAVDISSPSEDDLRVFRELEKMAASLNPDLPKTMGELRLVKVEAKLPREIHYYYEAPSNWKPNFNAESQLRESYRSSPQNEAFRRERVTKVWHYRDSFNNKIAVFRAGPNN